ncbi:MAG: RNA methyltransferase [Cytophagales bacterium]
MRKLKNEELDRKSMQDFKSSLKVPIIIVLDDVRSMNNIGSIFRTSDAFLIEKIYLCGITATPPHREIQKTALGATESVDWQYFENITLAINSLKVNNYEVVAVEQTTNSIYLDSFIAEKEKKYALIFGNEVDGVSEEAIAMCQYSLEIPQFGSKHSFNISVSVGIVLWDIFTKLNKN